MDILSMLRADFYKVGHVFQYPDNTQFVYSNSTPRQSRVPGVDKFVVFGLQYFIREWLINDFNKNFFGLPKDEVLRRYKRRMETSIGPLKSYDHIADLHELGYLPLRIKALPEGTLCPMRVPYLTICNTIQRFGWLTNALETHLSSGTWRAGTSATTAFEYRKTFQHYAKLTGADPAFVPWQGHDFSYRGLDSDSAIVSGAAHLLSFTGTDTIPAIDFLEQYYGADCEKELVGASVPATEHSVMCIGGQDGELQTIRRLLFDVYADAPVLSIVWDTWDFWKGLTEYLPALKAEILQRPGKLVIRPDSGDPVKIICGDPDWEMKDPGCPVGDGAIEVLWKIFGGRINDKGFRELDPHIGLIYGDSITPERQHQILEGLRRKGFASSNVVLGIGSYTYCYVTRDTYGQAIKATFGVVDGKERAIFKKPATDDGMKNSAQGLLQVYLDKCELKLRDNCTWLQEAEGLLWPVFIDGETRHVQTLSEIRNRLLAAL